MQPARSCRCSAALQQTAAALLLLLQKLFRNSAGRAAAGVTAKVCTRLVTASTVASEVATFSGSALATFLR